jgi:translation initiation factor 2B subunit (eIF-2B alpha/beta/delta family)
MGLVGFLYDKMGTYNIALYGSGRFLVNKMGTYNIALYGAGWFLV